MKEGKKGRWGKGNEERKKKKGQREMKKGERGTGMRR